MNNFVEIKLKAVSRNEAFARNAIAAFCVELNPTVDEIDDVKTVVSEAVTNCIVHAYAKREGEIILRACTADNSIHIEVEDFGMGIADVSEAVKPFFTKKSNEEHCGMGFTIMQSFSDDFSVENKKNGGVLVKLTKRFNKAVDCVG